MTNEEFDKLEQDTRKFMLRLRDYANAEAKRKPVYVNLGVYGDFTYGERLHHEALIDIFARLEKLEAFVASLQGGEYEG